MTDAGTGKSVVKALEVLKQHNVESKKVIVLTLFATPDSKLMNLLLLVTGGQTDYWHVFFVLLYK